mgnify:CR=1 FL=1
MEQTAEQRYSYWLESGLEDEMVKKELSELKGNTKEIEERFYRPLNFGTAGMRGIIGAGTNCMNIYTVRHATQGLAEYIRRQGTGDKGVVIGYDTRYYSDAFARETARVLVANGIKVYLFDTIHATPEVSFAIRYYGSASGVMITASHNPKEYNGYKAYGPDGAQFPPDATDVIAEVLDSFDIFKDVKTISDKELDSSPLLNIIGEEVNEAFLDAVYKQSIDRESIKKVADEFKLVYTPFHGTGLRPVTAILSRIGIKNVIVEPHQAVPDPAFSTVKSPNPEDKEGFNMAIELAKENNASLIIGTDPDADRVGVVVRDSEGEYRILSGNQIGALLCEYVLSAKKNKGTLSEKSTIIKSIVTSDMSNAIAANYGAQVINVLTGFKYIAEKIAMFEKTGSNVYEFGFEESYGYLPGTYARDKDSVGAVMLIAEMAASYMAKGMTLYDGLMEMFERYGYYEEKTVSIVMPGMDGMKKMTETMRNIRENMPDELGGIAIKTKQDYLTGIQYNSDGTTCSVGDFSKSDVLKFKLADNKTFVAIRPSGTEPKIKLYLGTAAQSLSEAQSQVNYLLGAVRGYLGL